MAYEGNPGVNALADVLCKRMKKESETPLAIEFGYIKDDYSLHTDTFPIPIPKADYTVCKHIGGLVFDVDKGEHSGHISGTGEHIHKVVVPIIKPGDRVLVAWVQKEAVVIDIAVPADDI